MKQTIMQDAGEKLILEIVYSRLPKGISYSGQPLSREEIIHYLRATAQQMEDGLI
jgi:hypothetical protein